MPPPLSEFGAKYCRLCALELKQGVSIFGDEGRRLGLSEKIRKTLTILVLEEDSLPKRICTECCSSLEAFTKYKDAVIDAQDKLTAIARKLEQNESQQSAPVSREVILPVQPLPTSLPVAFEEPENDFGGSGGGGPSRVNNGDDDEDIGSAVLQCGICGVAASSRSALESHHELTHRNDNDKSGPVYGCTFCPRISESYNAVRLHIYRHFKEGAFPCPDPGCDKSFPLKHHLDRHLKTSSHSQPQSQSSSSPKKMMLYPQPQPSPAKSSSSAVSRDDVKTKEDSGNEERRSPFFSPSAPSSPLDHHSEGFDDPGSHNNENDTVPEAQVQVTVQTTSLDKESSAVSADNDRDPGVWKCSTCSKQYETQRGYELHMTSKHIAQRWECPHCSKTFAQKNSLAYHLTSQHPSAPRQFKCDVCPKEFFTLKLLRRHGRLHTEPAAESKCPTCGKVYRSVLHLQAHMKFHKSKLNYVCGTCDKRFINQYKLDIHTNTHTGQRTLQCPHCPYAARTPGPFYRHIKIHNKSAEKGKKKEDKKDGRSVKEQPQLQSSAAQEIESPPSALEDLTTRSQSQGQRPCNLGPVGPELISPGHISQQQQQQQENHQQHHSIIVTSSQWSRPGPSSTVTAFDLMDFSTCEPNLVHAHATTTTATTLMHPNSSMGCPTHYQQNEPMELSYKLHIEPASSGQEMPIELTKVFQRDPLELCVRGQDLMDLSSRVSMNSMGMGGMDVGMGMSYHKEIHLAPFQDLSGAFRQPIDLIARPESDQDHHHHHNGNHGHHGGETLVDLSLRSDQSSFLRELIDLSSRSDSFHSAELDLTTPTNHSGNGGSGGKGNESSMFSL